MTKEQFRQLIELPEAVFVSDTGSVFVSDAGSILGAVSGTGLVDDAVGAGCAGVQAIPRHFGRNEGLDPRCLPFRPEHFRPGNGEHCIETTTGRHVKID